MYEIHCKVYIYILHCKLYIADCTVYVVQDILFTDYLTLTKMYTVPFTVYTAHCKLYYMSCTLYTIYLTKLKVYPF